MQHRLNSIIYKVAALLAVLGLIGFVGQLLMLRAIYMRKTKRMTWTMRLININSMFALSYLIILTPIGKRKIPVYCGHFVTATTKADISRYNWAFIRCLSDIRTLISTNWKQSRLTCKYSMFWLYVCSGVSIISNAVLTLG